MGVLYISPSSQSCDILPCIVVRSPFSEMTGERGFSHLPGTQKGDDGRLPDQPLDGCGVAAPVDSFHALKYRCLSLRFRGWYVVGGPDVAALQFRKTPQ